MYTYWKGEDPMMLANLEFDGANSVILNTYTPRTRVALLTVCSWAKPYSQSHIHRAIRQDLMTTGPKGGLLNQIDYIHLSSAGVIPHACEKWYPFTAYDWNNARVDTEALTEALEVYIAERLMRFVKRFESHYSHWVTYFRGNSTTSKAILRVQEQLPLTRSQPYIGSPAEVIWRNVFVSSRISADMTVRESLLSGYCDPDVALTLPVNLDQLQATLKEVLDVQE